MPSLADSASNLGVTSDPAKVMGTSARDAASESGGNALDNHHDNSSDFSATGNPEDSPKRLLRRGSSFELTDEQAESLMSIRLEEGSFSSWFIGFVVVKFDILEGQKIEDTYPCSLRLSPVETQGVCFSAFPDAMAATVGDHVYSFRVSGKTHEDFFYGSVFCRQQRDAREKRGFFQKSLVLLANWPAFTLMEQVVQLAGPGFFQSGIEWIHAVADDISKWPHRNAGMHYELPLAGSVLDCVAPLHMRDSVWKHCPTQHNCKPLSSVPYKPFIKQSMLLWELIIRGKPLLVIGHSPPLVQQMVVCLSTIISPILFAGDYRPYFTIHDCDAKELLSESGPPKQSLIIGTTNPFFLKMAVHWPHVIGISGSEGTVPSDAPVIANKPSNVTKTLQPSNQQLPNCILSNLNPILKMEKSALQYMQQASSSSSSDSGLRMHLARVTSEFLQPFQAYIQPCASPGVPIPVLPLFDSAQFCSSISTPMLGATFRKPPLKEVKKVYSDFVQTSHFFRWFKLTRAQSLASALKSVLNGNIANIEQSLSSLGEVRLVDIMLRIQDDLLPPAAVGSEHEDLCEGVLSALLTAVPSDLEAHLRRQMKLSH